MFRKAICHDYLGEANLEYSHVITANGFKCHPSTDNRVFLSTLTATPACPRGKALPSDWGRGCHEQAVPETSTFASFHNIRICLRTKVASVLLAAICQVVLLFPPSSSLLILIFQSHTTYDSLNLSAIQRCTYVYGYVPA